MLKENKNKKGMLLASETLKMVLSIISIGILIFLLAAIYFSTTSDKKLEEAQGVMSNIKTAFDSFSATKTSQEFDGIGPGGWTLFVYADNDDKPNICGGEDCICICDDTTFSSQLKECTKNGACEIFSPLEESADIEIAKDGTTNIVVSKEENWFKVNKI